MQVPINLFVFYTAVVTLNSLHANHASNSAFVKFLICCKNCHYVMQCNGFFFNLYIVQFYTVFTNNQQMHFLTVLFLYSTAPTCFDARASSSGSFSMPAELHANLCYPVVNRTLKYK
jgi:hypothetical protein